MPVVRYSLQVLEDVFSEVETFSPTNNPAALVTREIVQPLQARREKLGEPGISLAKIEILNPYVHQHVWERGRVDKFAMKAHYHCLNCHVTGFRKFHLFQGEYGPMVRDDQYRTDRFSVCREPLRPMPKTLVFG